MHEIRMILGNVAAPSEPAMTGIVPGQSVFPDIRSLTVIREDLPAGHCQLFPVLLKTGEHREIALIQYRTAEPLDVAGAFPLLLCGSSVLRHGGIGTEKRQGAADKDLVFHGHICAMLALSTARQLGSLRSPD